MPQLTHEGYEVAKKFFTGTSSSYDRVVNLTTFGKDRLWKRAIVDLIPHGPYKVLDLACGTGILSLELAKKVGFVVGLDIAQESIEIARKKSAMWNVKNVHFLVAAAEALPKESKSFDFVTASYLPKYCDVKSTVSEISRVLKKGGNLIMHDFTYPNNYFQPWWNLYFRLLKVAGIFIPSWKVVFKELDRVIKHSNWKSELIQAMKGNGFVEIRSRSMTIDTAAMIWGKLDN